MIRPVKLEKHGPVRTDSYYWLRERQNPEVIEYLNAENEYTDAVMSHTQDLQHMLFQEIKNRIKQDDSTLSYPLDNYFYYKRYEQEKDFPIYCRKKQSLQADEEIILDVNLLAPVDGYIYIPQPQISFNHDIIAYAADTVGRRFNTIYFKDLKTGELLADEKPNVTANICWANDNRSFYSKQDPNTLRSYQIYRHQLGTDFKSDQLVFKEKDKTFYCEIRRTKSKKYLVIDSSQTLGSEVRFLDAFEPQGEFKLFQKRERDHEYTIDHHKDHFYILTNRDARNGEMVPLSPVYRLDQKKENGNPLLIHAYASYRHSRDPYFDPHIISLLDRGFVYAIAHVRGGQELGCRWY